MALLLIAGLVTGTTAANHVPPSKAGISYHPASAQALAPAVCAGMGLQTLAWKDSGTLRGTPGNDLLLGSDKNNRIEGDNGNDCLIGGGGKNDRLDGGPGTDVCIGNADARFDNCEVIIGGSGENAAASTPLQERYTPVRLQRRGYFRGLRHWRGLGRWRGPAGRRAGCHPLSD